MDSKLIVLKLFVQGLGIDGEIDNFQGRKDFQKAVLLGQSISGIDLGYRFNWYLYGPYSPALARDYYQIAEAIEFGDREYEKHYLVDAIREKLDGIRSLFNVPEDLNLSQSDWLELLASWHYLISISKYDDKQASETIKRTKPHLAPYIENAKKTLI
ncbi:hypothetical protein FBR06_11160 [Betaproteobacteria bacterium PRO4]|nr:hypothetical protein [Betaproteobacteria bacterium PRO4]RIK94896.1 MAG: hypothetical protein DCC73_00445 [Pseudomonadota bacterium]